MPNNVIQLPYTAQEIQNLLTKVSEHDLDWTYTEEAFQAFNNSLQGEDGSIICVDISSYVPQDDYKYEVLTEVDLYSSGNIAVYGDNGDSSRDGTYVGNTTARAYSSDNGGMGSVSTIITSGKLYIRYWSPKSSNCTIWLQGYRRAGRKSAS